MHLAILMHPTCLDADSMALVFDAGERLSFWSRSNILVNNSSY